MSYSIKRLSPSRHEPLFELHWDGEGGNKKTNTCRHLAAVKERTSLHPDGLIQLPACVIRDFCWWSFSSWIESSSNFNLPSQHWSLQTVEISKNDSYHQPTSFHQDEIDGLNPASSRVIRIKQERSSSKMDDVRRYWNDPDMAGEWMVVDWTSEQHAHSFPYPFLALANHCIAFISDYNHNFLCCRF